MDQIFLKVFEISSELDKMQEFCKFTEHVHNLTKYT